MSKAKSPRKSPRKCLIGRVSYNRKSKSPGKRCLGNMKNAVAFNKNKKRVNHLMRANRKCALRSPRGCVSPNGLRHVGSPRKYSPRKKRLSPNTN
jgi:hypothetical protein